MQATESSGPSNHASNTAKYSLTEVVNDLEGRRFSSWAWQNFEHTVKRLVEAVGASSVMEIGAGRRPTFDQRTIEEWEVNYIANDISARELGKAPSYVKKACFDIGGADQIPMQPFQGEVDVIFSKMVFEHIRDTNRAYSNIANLLRPGGVCINFHPVLFSPPFVINYALPEALTQRLLRRLHPRRHDEGEPKFPAYYNGCMISAPQNKRIQQAGFRNVWQIPFFRHEYFRRIPVVREIDSALSNLAERRNWSSLASYSFTIAMK